MTLLLITALAISCLFDIFIIALIAGAWMKWCAKDDPADEPDYSGGV